MEKRIPSRRTEAIAYSFFAASVGLAIISISQQYREEQRQKEQAHSSTNIVATTNTPVVLDR